MSQNSELKKLLREIKQLKAENARLVKKNEELNKKTFARLVERVHVPRVRSKITEPRDWMPLQFLKEAAESKTKPTPWQSYYSDIIAKMKKEHGLKDVSIIDDEFTSEYYQSARLEDLKREMGGEDYYAKKFELEKFKREKGDKLTRKELIAKQRELYGKAYGANITRMKEKDFQSLQKIIEELKKTKLK